MDIFNKEFNMGFLKPKKDKRDKYKTYGWALNVEVHRQPRQCLGSMKVVNYLFMKSENWTVI